jgi:hypothetical protein
MFILFHLITGFVIGSLLADRLDDRRAILPCVLGALLPDLVDKPLGLFILGAQFANGRIFSHTLLAAGLILAIGALAYHRYRSPLLISVGVGVASHQVLDLMWQDRRSWLYPFYGQFRPINTEGWFLRELLLELQNPVEWVSGLLLLLLLVALLSPGRTKAFAARYGRVLRPLVLGAVPLLTALGLFLVASGLVRRFTPLTGWSEPWYNIVGGLVLVLTAFAAYRLSWKIALLAPDPGVSPGA